MSGLLLLVLAIPQPIDHPIQVDLIERNHRVYADGSTFNQWILWEWQTDHFCVRDWCIEKNGRLRKVGDVWELTKREDRGYLFVVHSFDYRETWTFKDPEVEDREDWPIEWRNRVWKHPENREALRFRNRIWK